MRVLVMTWPQGQQAVGDFNNPYRNTAALCLSTGEQLAFSLPAKDIRALLLRGCTVWTKLEKQWFMVSTQGGYDAAGKESLAPQVQGPQQPTVQNVVLAVSEVGQAQDPKPSLQQRRHTRRVFVAKGS